MKFFEVFEFFTPIFLGYLLVFLLYFGLRMQRGIREHLKIQRIKLTLEAIDRFRQTARETEVTPISVLNYVQSVETYSTSLKSLIPLINSIEPLLVGSQNGIFDRDTVFLYLREEILYIYGKLRNLIVHSENDAYVIEKFVVIENAASRILRSQNV